VRVFETALSQVMRTPNTCSHTTAESIAAIVAMAIGRRYTLRSYRRLRQVWLRVIVTIDETSTPAGDRWNIPPAIRAACPTWRSLSATATLWEKCIQGQRNETGGR
jgi:hypothetical protein